MIEQTWSEDFQRLILVHALRGDLLDKLPLDPELFASALRGSKPPRQRLAEVLTTYYETYGVRPSWTVYQQLVQAELALLGPEERQVVEGELAALELLEAATDPGFVGDQVKAAAEYRALQRGLQQATELLAEGPSSLDEAREILAKAAAPLQGGDEWRRVEYVAEAEDRMREWTSGDMYGLRIGTGFPELDRALSGGPTPGEVWYFLAPPKGAKTASLLTVAAAALRRRLGVYLVTYEMQAIRMALRMDRMFARRTKEELEQGADHMASLSRAIHGLRMIGAPELYIDERPSQQPNCVEDVRRNVDAIRKAGGRVDLVVLDYLNIMGAAREEREKRHELPRISREMANFAKQDGVLLWSAALVNRKAVNKEVIHKTDIAEAFEVIAVADGVVAICATEEMALSDLRRFYVAAAREEADEKPGGDYQVDFARMLMLPAVSGAVDAAIERGADRKKKKADE